MPIDLLNRSDAPKCSGCKSIQTKDSFENFERFLSYWQNDPLGMNQFLGKAIAYVGSRHLYDLFFYFGTAYFASMGLCSRINYLYEYWGNSENKEVFELFEMEMRQEILCLKDIGGEYKNIHMMAVRDKLNNTETYVLRFFIDEGEESSLYLDNIWKDRETPTFVKVLAKLTHSNSDQQYGEDQRFWSFQCAKDMTDGVIVFPETYGFYNLWETKGAADLIALASDSCGYV